MAFLTASISREGGGVAEVVRLLAQHLNSRPDLEVQTLGLLDAYSKADAAFWAPLDVQACRVIGPRSFGFSPQLISAVRSTNADVLHSHGLWMFPSVANLQLGTGRLPTVISPHGMLNPHSLGISRWKKRIAGLLFENANLRRAACLHALNLAELEAIRSLGLTNPVCVVPNGFTVPPYTVRPHQNRSILGAQTGQRVLLHLGRIHPTKGLGALLEAWASIRKRAPAQAERWVLAIAGWERESEGHERQLRRRTNSMNVGNSVRFLGPRFGVDKIAALQAADAFVLASVNEGLPMAVLEAWAHLLPVMMTPQCNLPEGFEAGAALRVIPDSGSLINGLETLFAMSDFERQQMGERGRHLVERSFTWARTADRLQSVYQWLVTGGPRPECVET